jgi:hypothetical protein
LIAYELSYLHEERRPSTLGTQIRTSWLYRINGRLVCVSADHCVSRDLGLRSHITATVKRAPHDLRPGLDQHIIYNCIIPTLKTSYVLLTNSKNAKESESRLQCMRNTLVLTTGWLGYSNENKTQHRLFNSPTWSCGRRSLNYRH